MLPSGSTTEEDRAEHQPPFGPARKKPAHLLVYALPVRLFDFFRRKPETAAEHQALANLDEATRQVAWEECDTEKEREQGGGSFGPLTPTVPRDPPVPFHHVEGDSVPEPVDDPDPPSLRAPEQDLGNGSGMSAARRRS